MDNKKISFYSLLSRLAAFPGCSVSHYINPCILFVIFLVLSDYISIPIYADEMSSGSMTFNKIEQSWQEKLDKSIAELSSLQDEIKNKKIDLNKELNGLENELSKIRGDYQQVTRMLDASTLEQVNLRSQIQSRKDEKSYLLNSLLDPYARSFETRLHIAETRRYASLIEEAKNSIGNDNLSDIEIYKAQAEMVQASIQRLEEALGGTRFDGTAVDESGKVKSGTFILIGPAAIFRSHDGESVGTAEQHLGSLEPTLTNFESPEMAKNATDLVTNGNGTFPLDPTLGNAHAIEATKESLLEHIKKGGVVMYPILALAAAALAVAVFKWIELLRVPKTSEKRIIGLLEAVANQDEEKAVKEASAIGGPTGDMLCAGVKHIKEPSSLIEEVMYEKILIAKMKLQSLLPFIAISAAASPLLGLLGTVTGIINTFKLITVFGSGDVKTLSGGISEALITTEFGLIVAIPSLLLHAFLSRKARGIIARMEKAAISFVNQISKTQYKKDDISESLAKLPAEVAHEVLRSLGQENITENEVPEYLENSAGSIMDSNVISIGNTATVADAIYTIRTAEVDENISIVFVVDENGKYIGDVYINKLLTRPENTRISSVVDTNTLFVHVDTKKESVRDLFNKYNLNIMPVLNRNDQLVGHITADSINGNSVKRSVEL